MDFEYKTHVLNTEVSFLGGKFDSDSMDVALNKFAKDGWELVNVVASNKGYGETRALIFFFKRIKK